MPQASSSWYLPLSIAFAAVIALLVGLYVGSVYQKATDDSALRDKDSLILAMQREFSTRPGASVPAPTPTLSPTPTPSSQTPLISAFSLPKKGDRLCRGDTLTLFWKANSLRIDQIRITINAPFPAGPLADVPVSWNETGANGEGSIDWKVGSATVGSTNMDLPDGELYRIHLDALQNGAVVSSQDSGLFAIGTCQG